jgi:NADH:ubiquinone oxidoreductase subunit B-like Fe-S oxidoreductase
MRVDIHIPGSPETPGNLTKSLAIEEYIRIFRYNKNKGYEKRTQFYQ